MHVYARGWGGGQSVFLDYCITKTYLFLFCVYECLFACVQAHHEHARCLQRGSDPLKLEVKMAVSCQVGPGSQPWSFASAVSSLSH